MARVETAPAVWRILHRAKVTGRSPAISPSRLPSTLHDRQKVRLPGIGLSASASTLYAGGEFNRDGSESSRHELRYQPQIAEDTITTAVRHQGTKENSKSEAAKGKYHHEHRDEEMLRVLEANGIDQQTLDNARKIFLEISQKWDGDEKSVTYYGAVDTTPAIINLVGDFVEMYPERDLLNKIVTRKDGQEITVGESIIEAYQYLTTSLQKSDLGLLEYQHQNPRGIQNQYFKDSITSLIFTDPEKHINFKAPIAEIGVQGITYDALEKGKKLLTPEQMSEMLSVTELGKIFAKEDVWDKFDAREIKQILKRIENGEKTTFEGLQMIIQRQVLNLFWMPEYDYFASAIDRDPTTGELRAVDSIASNPAALLNTSFFDNLTGNRNKRCVEAIARKITGPEFLTEAGHRGRSLRHRNALRHPVTGEVLDDYHGVFVVWPNEVYNTAKGLERQGLYQLAEQLKIRHTNAFNIAGSHNEFHLVDEDGRLQVHKLKEKPKPQKGITYTIFNNSNHTEDTQTWGVTSNYALKKERQFRQATPEYMADWQRDLDHELIEILQQTGQIQILMKTRSEIESARKKGGTYYTDAQKGQELDTYFRETWGYEPWREAALA